MAIRIIGVIGAILGLLWFVNGVASLSDIMQLPNTAYYMGHKAGTIVTIPLGLFFLIYGTKWAIRGYDKKTKKSNN